MSGITRRVGVLGGTFDPPHLGHLIVADQVLSALSLDEVVLVPANQPWQKIGHRSITEAKRRLTMTEEAVGDAAGLSVSPIELELGGPSYTSVTLTALAEQQPGTEWSVIVGADAAAGLDTWHDTDRLREQATIVVVNRPGGRLPAADRLALGAGRDPVGGDLRHRAAAAGGPGGVDPFPDPRSGHRPHPPVEPLSSGRLRWIAALLMHRRRVLVLFALAEVLLALAIPFLLIRGYHTLLDSRAGTFVEEPDRADPGWAALVDPTEVIGVAEIDQGMVTGVTLLVDNPEAASLDSVVLAPGSLSIGGSVLSERGPEEAVMALSEAVRLGVERVVVLDAEGWQGFLGETRYTIDNPDPVPGEEGEEGEVLVPVGPVEIGAAEAGAFVGRPAPGAPPVSVVVRRELLWTAVLADPPSTDSALALELADLDSQGSRLFELPLGEIEPVPMLDTEAAELLIRDLVAYPVGSDAADRLRVRLVDRTGSAPLEGLAAAVAAEGVEVIEIANAGVFDGGATQIIAPAGLADPGVESPLALDLADLSRALGVTEVVVDGEPADASVVTVLVGSDLDIAGL